MEKGRRKTITAASPLTEPDRHKLRRTLYLLCALAIVLAVAITHHETQRALRKSCASVTEAFTAIMDGYQHSFRLFEKLLQQEIKNAEDADAIEAFLKEQDKELLAIEGEDYDGVYMYYQGRYLYSWDTPYAVYAKSGYDATKRPWYTGAVAAKGEPFFSVPYPSYANDYMLATISRLQADGETVIAYDIKLGEIGSYVERLDIFNGALTLICDADGNIIGSTNPLYQGGNYTLDDEALTRNIGSAHRDMEIGVGAEEAAKAYNKLQSTLALQSFCKEKRAVIASLLKNAGTLRYFPETFSFGFAYTGGAYACFVLTSIKELLPFVALLWVALASVFMISAVALTHMMGKNRQILTDVLTGLNNRRAFLKYCDAHMQHYAGDTLCLLMMDLDKFKKINDQFGHVAGDHALTDTAEALKSACEGAYHNFFLCRYGGDEFLLAGRNCGEEEMAQLKASIEKGLEKKNQSGVNPYTLEISMGTAHGKCCKTADLERLLEIADQEMYEDKMRKK